MRDITKILTDIQNEMDRQDVKWGIRHQHNMIWLTILLEEAGEVAESILKKDWINLRKELVQVVAVGMQWLIDIDSKEKKIEGWEAG